MRTWVEDPKDLRKLDSLVSAWKLVSPPPDSGRNDRYLIQSFYFDPNVTSEDSLLRLGFDSRVARRIISYRSKGGKFRAKSELLKIYGIDSAFYREIAGFIKIRPQFGQRERLPPIAQRDRSEKKRWPARKPPEPLDINTADTVAFDAVWGIGQKLSVRIIKYRSALGGFVHVGQLSEVFGLDSTALSNLMQVAFVAPDFLPHRIDLNAATDGELSAHPYLSRQEAKTIVAWRFQHGRFAAVSDLVKLPMFDAGKIRRIEPYFIVAEQVK